MSLLSKLVAGTLLLSVAGCDFAQDAANKLVDESNVASQAANKDTADAAKLYAKLITDDVVKGLPGNRAQIKPDVDQAASLFEKSAKLFRESAQKLEEAAGKPVDAKIIEYWKLVAEAARKRAAQKDALRKIVLLLTDESVTNVETFNAKAAPLIAEANQADKDSDETEGKAKKVQAENKDKIKQTN